MELSPSWEAANCVATQELPSILWNPKVHYRYHKGSPLVPGPDRSSPYHPYPISLRPILTLSTHLCLGVLSGLSFWLSHQYPSHLCHMPCPSHSPWLDHSIFGKEYKLLKLLIMQFCPISHHFISLQSKYSQHPVLKHPQSVFLP
jgi:hypothetical protein